MEPVRSPKWALNSPPFHRPCRLKFFRGGQAEWCWAEVRSAAVVFWWFLHIQWPEPCSHFFGSHQHQGFFLSDTSGQNPLLGWKISIYIYIIIYLYMVSRVSCSFFSLTPTQWRSWKTRFCVQAPSGNLLLVGQPSIEKAQDLVHPNICTMCASNP